MEEEQEEEFENYIEINEYVTKYYNDWMYDAIINKTLKEAEEEADYDLIELLLESKRESAGFLGILHLENKEFRLLCRYMDRAYKNSYEQAKRIYIRKAHNQFLREFKELLEYMVRDDRYTMI